MPQEQLPERLSWFRHAGLGLFIHWDHASQHGYEISWPVVGGHPLFPGHVVSTPEEYHASARTFDPQDWDPGRLASLASSAGAAYAIFTAKHLSGWAAWPSAVPGAFSIASSPYGQRAGDLVRDFVAAFRAAGLRIGLYFSLPDWHHPDYAHWPPDQRPYPVRPAMPEPDAWQRYLGFLRDQLTELLTSYGPVDLLWFDGAWEREDKAWQPAELAAQVRALAPEIIINDRLPGHGDYVTPENYDPYSPAGRSAWELCLTMGEAWAWVPEDDDYKSAAEIIRTLAEVASRGGNLLLDVGPTGTGALGDRQQQVLERLAAWMEVHRESVLNVEPGLEPWQFYGPSTRRGDTLYLHLAGWPEDNVVVRGVDVLRVHAVTMLSTGVELAFRGRLSIPDLAAVATGMPAVRPAGDLVITVPDRRPDTELPVIAVQFSATPPAIEDVPWMRTYLRRRQRSLETS